MCVRPHNSVTASKEDTKKAVRGLEVAEIFSAVFKFHERVEVSVMAEHGHVEWIFCPLFLVHKLKIFNLYRYYSFTYIYI